MGKINKKAIVNADQEGVQCFGFAQFLPGHPVQDKIDKFFELFSALPDDRVAYRPLFLVNNHSSSGEVAESFGLFVKDDQLFEVVGSECSVWDFNGQWEPEPTTPEAILYRIENGSLGRADYAEDNFGEELKALMQRLSASVPATSSKKRFS